MYQRISINLFAIRGEDILKIGDMPADDEAFLTMEHPKQIKRRELPLRNGNPLTISYSVCD